MTKLVRHAAYPHLAGSLFDCPACEAVCYCKPDETHCVHCSIADETRDFNKRVTGYVARFNY